MFPPGVGKGAVPASCSEGSFLPAAPTRPSSQNVLAPLTLLPVAEGIPGLAQVASGAVVHDAHSVSPTAGVGVGCGVSRCAIVQPTHQTQMESHLPEEDEC